MRITGLLPPGAGSNKERLRHLNGSDVSNPMSPFAKFVNFSLIAAAVYHANTAGRRTDHVTEIFLTEINVGVLLREPKNGVAIPPAIANAS
jgi:hypothetical protein